MAKRTTLVGIGGCGPLQFAYYYMYISSVDSSPSGVGHEDLVRLATSTFGSMPEGDSVTVAQADFVGGMLPNTSLIPPYTHLCLPADWTTALYSCDGFAAPPLPHPPHVCRRGGPSAVRFRSDSCCACLPGGLPRGNPHQGPHCWLAAACVGRVLLCQVGWDCIQAGQGCGRCHRRPVCSEPQLGGGGRSGGCEEGLGRCCVCAVSASGVCDEECSGFVCR